MEPRIKTINCSLKLIQKAISEKWIRPLALFYAFKLNYKNSTIYHYRTRMQEISDLYGISNKTLYNYLAILKNKNLAFDFKDNLSLESNKKLKACLNDKRKTSITAYPTECLWDIQCKLYVKVIEYHFKRIAFMEAIRRYGMRKRKTDKEAVSEGAFSPSFSVRNTAKLLKIGNKSAIRVLKTLESLEIIAIKKNKITQVTTDILPVNKLDDFPGYKYNTKDGTFILFGNTIELLEFPAKLPKIDTKIYTKYYKSVNCK